MAKNQLFYVGQKTFINKGKKVLVLFTKNDHLDFPGGRVQEGEVNFNEALKREVREETGLEIEVGNPFVNWYVELGKDHPEAGAKIYLLGFKCKYVSGEIKLSDAHNKFRWVDKNNYKGLDERSDYFKALEKYFEG